VSVTDEDGCGDENVQVTIFGFAPKNLNGLLEGPGRGQAPEAYLPDPRCGAKGQFSLELDDDPSKASVEVWVVSRYVS